MKIRRYSELSRFDTFKERFSYLKVFGKIGINTFGNERYINQSFYASREWKRVRDYVITRDLGCDLGVPGYEVPSFIVIHHMNPLSIEDIENCTEFLLDPEYLITTSDQTHRALHYGNNQNFDYNYIERKPYDTCPWRQF